MKQIDIKNRINKMRENSQNNSGDDKLENPNEKKCPFRDIACGPHCKLFRANKQGYECPFQEIPSMSWNLKNLVKKLIG